MSARTVLHLLPSFGWGGAERMACAVHRSALAHGWRSHVETLPAVREAVISETGGDPAAVSSSASTLRRWTLGAAHRVRALRPDVVHAHLPYPDRLGAVLAVAAGRPTVVTFQLLPRAGQRWPRDALLLLPRSEQVLRLAAGSCRRLRLVTVSRNDFDEVARMVPAARLRFVANAPPRPRAVSPLPDVQRSWPPETVRLLSVGRLHRQKGFDRVVTALADPSLRALPWHWVIVGAGEERETLERRVREAGLVGRVTFAGEQPSEPYFRAAELLIAPSVYEGLPLVPMEAMDAGLPAVVSDIAAHVELFPNTPEALLPDDTRAWGARLSRLLLSSEERERLARAQRTVTGDERRRRMWEAYAAVYREAVTGSGVQA